MIKINKFRNRVIFIIFMFFLLAGITAGQGIKLNNENKYKWYNIINNNFPLKEYNIILSEFLHMLYQPILFICLVGVEIGYILYFIPFFIYNILMFCLTCYMLYVLYQTAKDLKNDD